MASFLRRPSNNATTANAKKNIVRFGSPEPPVGAPVKPTKKGSFVSLLTGGGSSANNLYYDNGVDPFGRLSTDSVPPPPPSPVMQAKPVKEVPKHWVDEIFPLAASPSNYPAPPSELLVRVQYFLKQKDPLSMDKSLHLAVYAQLEGEPALNAKLYHRFGDGLPLRLPGQKVTKMETPVPKTLRELLRAFLREHDPGYLAIEGEGVLDDMMAQAAEYGIDSLEAELCRKYGYGLNGRKNSAKVFLNPEPVSPQQAYSRDNSSYELMAQAAMPVESSSPGPFSPTISATKSPFDSRPPATNAPMLGRIDKAKSEKPQTFVELGVDDDDRTSMKPLISPMSATNNQPKPVKKHDFFDDKSLRADLKAFYTKHDRKKLEPQKFEPIVQWAYKIGPSELNRRFEEKYGESLNQFIEDQQAGRPGVAPGPKNVPAKIEDNRGEQETVAACRNYQEAKAGKSFGVCTCGFSRVDHRNITSLLVPGFDEPNFSKAKPKVVITKKSTPPPTAAPTSNKTTPTPTGSNAPKVQPVPVVPKPAPKFEVKAEGKDGPCSEYRLDLEGRSFGVCKCGWARAEHFKAKQRAAWATQDD